MPKSLVFLLLLLFSLSVQAEKTLRIGTMDLPPYGWEDGSHKKHGIIYEMNEEIGKRSGLKFTNQILPFKRMFKMLKNGDLDLISSQPHKDALEAGEKLTVQHDVSVILVPKRDLQIASINDLANKSIAHHHGASYPALDSLNITITRVSDYREMVKQLFSNPNLSAGIFSAPAYYYWVKKLGLSPRNFGTPIVIPNRNQQWIIVNKAMPLKLKMKIKKEIDQIYQENLFETLLKKYR